MRRVIAVLDRQIKRGARKKLGRYLKRLEARGHLPPDVLLELRREVYDFQMERGIAKSQYGLKTFGQLEAAASFRRSMFLQYQRNFLADNPLRPLFEDKKLCYEFVDRLGVRRPATTEVMTAEEVIAGCRRGFGFPRFVVKTLNASNSKGVYLVGGEGSIVRVKGGAQLKSLEEMQASMRADLASGHAPADQWFVEEAILMDEGVTAPPHDLKFFAFYGEVGVVAEIKRGERAFVCWWTPEGAPTKGFRGFDPFEGNGFTAGELELARSISQRIPMPYARIDFLKNNRGDFVFGEIEVNTGGFEKFPRSTDKLLGEYYLRAEQRLFWDVWRGRRYPDIEAVARKLPGYVERGGDQTTKAEPAAGW